MGECTCKSNQIEVYVELAGKERFHSSLMGRDEENQHPISAITNLQETLDELYVVNNAYTKEEIDSKLENILTYKGSVSQFESLPVVDNRVGDVYNICATGDNYVWTGKGWDNLSGRGTEHTDWATRDYVDGSITNVVRVVTSHMGAHYYNKDEIDEMLNGPNSALNVMVYRGDVANFESLPKEDIKIGQVYSLEDTKEQYFWDGFHWQLVGIDSYTKLELDNKLSEEYTKLYNNIINLQAEINKANEEIIKTNQELDNTNIKVSENANLIADNINKISENENKIDGIAEKLAIINNKLKAIDDKFVEIDEDLSQTVKYSLWDNRKTIQLNNHDSISGITTNGDGANLIMLSKWDVVDVGSNKVHMNLNTKDIVTVNDDSVVITDRLLENLVKPGDNISIEKKSVTDPQTQFSYNTYEISSDLSSYYTIDQVDNFHKDINNRIEEVKDASENQWLSMGEVISDRNN